MNICVYGAASPIIDKKFIEVGEALGRTLGERGHTLIFGGGNSGLMGAVVAVLNFLFMAIGISLAADKAQEQNVKGGKSLVTGSYMLRIVLMFVVLFACAKSGHFHVIALVLPLVFVRPILTVAEFFQKKGSDM